MNILRRIRLASVLLVLVLQSCHTEKATDQSTTVEQSTTPAVQTTHQTTNKTSPATESSKTQPTVNKPTTHPTTTVQASSVPINCSYPEHMNDTECKNSPTHKPKDASANKDGGLIYNMLNKKDFQLYMRAFYVVIAVTAVVVIYLVVKAIIVRRRKRKARRYDTLNGTQLQMGAMTDEEEDDLFDQSRRRLIS